MAVAHKLRLGAPTPNEPQEDDGEAQGVLRGPVPPGSGLTGKTVSLHDCFGELWAGYHPDQVATRPTEQTPAASSSSEDAG